MCIDTSKKPHFRKSPMSNEWSAEFMGVVFYGRHTSAVMSDICAYIKRGKVVEGRINSKYAAKEHKRRVESSRDCALANDICPDCGGDVRTETGSAFKAFFRGYDAMRCIECGTQHKRYHERGASSAGC